MQARFLLIALSLLFLSSTNLEAKELSPPVVKEKLIELHKIKGKDLGVLGNILDRVFLSGLKTKKIKHFAKEKSNKKESLSFGLAFFLTPNKEGNFKNVIYRNGLLFPAEERIIELRREEETIKVKIKYKTLFGRIGKEVVLSFPKGKVYPRKSYPDCLCWGEVNEEKIKKELEGIKEIILDQNLIKSKQSRGELGKILDETFNFIPKIRGEDVFILKKLSIKGIPIQKAYADCYLIGVNLTLVAIYDMHSYITSLYKIRRIGPQLIIRQFSFVPNGLNYFQVVYDIKRLNIKENKAYHFTFGHLNPS